MSLDILFLIASLVGVILPLVLAHYYKNDGIDRWRWLLFSKAIRDNSLRTPTYIDRYIFKHRFSYPPLFLKILALIPNKKRENYSYLISPIVSLFEGFLIFFFVLKISNSIAAASISLALYSTTPANIIENFYLNTRCFGQFIFTLSIFSIYFYVTEGRLFFAALLATCILLNSHRMTLQLYFFSIIAISFYFETLRPLLLLLLSVLICIVITKSQCLVNFKAHYTQLNYYRILFQKNKEKISIKVKPLLLAIFGRNLYLGLAYYIYFTNNVGFSQLANYCIIISAIILFAAISSTFIKDLLFIGEGYRYIGFATPFVAIFLGINYNYINNNVLILFFIISILAVLYKHYIFLFGISSPFNNTKINEELEKILDSIFLNKNINYRFMSYPPVYDDYVAYHYENTVVAFHDNGLACEDMKEFTPHFLVNPNLSNLIDKFKIDVLVSHKKIMTPISTHQERIINDSIYLYVRQ